MTCKVPRCEKRSTRYSHRNITWTTYVRQNTIGFLGAGWSAANPDICALSLVDAQKPMGGPGDGFGRRRSSRHARAAAETAGCRLGRLRGRRRATSAAPPSTSGLPGRRLGEVSSLSVGRCVSRRVGRSSEVDGSISRLGLRFLGLFAGAGALCSLDSRK